MSDEKSNLASSKLSIPEPPKFNLDDLPEPPKLDMNLPKNEKTKQNNEQLNPQQNKLEKPSIEIEKKEDKKNNLSSQKIGDLTSFEQINKKQTKSFFSFLFKNKQKEEKIDLFPVVQDIPSPDLSLKKEQLADLNDLSFAPPSIKDDLSAKDEQSASIEKNISKMPNQESKKQENIPEIPKIETQKLEPELKIDVPNYNNLSLHLETVDESMLDDKEKEMLEEGEHFVREEEMLEEGENYLKNQEQKETPISEVKGIGDSREKKLKKLGIKTAENLASLTFKDLAKKLKIPESQAKKIVSNARKITRIKKKLKQAKIKETGITGIVKKLENERKKVELMQKVSKITEDKLIEIQGHDDLVKILEALEKRRRELAEQERNLSEKEMKLASHDETYRRELEQIENLKRRLDHDIRERTQYLINLEKDYFQRGQILAKKQSDIEAREKELEEKHNLLKQKEEKLKIQAAEIEDRAITLNSKEKKYEQIVRDLEKQDMLLKEKEDDLLKREADYIKRLDTLESHEKTILKNLEEKRKKLELKEKEVELKEQQLRKKERLIDKKGVAIEYEKGILETQKDKLVDDEFEQYLHEQLGLLKTTGINIDDINFVKTMPSIEKDNAIYQLIDTCRDLVKANKVKEAKIFYNQLRDKYYSTNFSDKEKENIHNMLRTLYDEINLADISSNK